ncbi:multifunctional CCA addition/repair protein [Maricurvus nonylphenolicus]|uniref:multifunctional CCA addition/repair protein n=1 Tax=Maricurvus nonylphenolicus TaxID=1008307 RepID=UPI0036F3ED89
MQIYLVGGAVRDKLLGYPYSERDWVVVGASPQTMEAEGFRAVGKDFPVFLHPDSKEEYALARTERKTGPGYTGFDFYAASDVTLEQDLQRRDLTINAIAEDSDGNLVDPYNGKTDLDNKILRHVSAAFSEDPVRILRVARFAARYHHLGFKVAEETLQLMRDMVNNGEVDHLVAERVWKEWQRALTEKSPGQFIEVLRQCGALQAIMPEIDNLFGVPQRADHHPEIDTGIHSLMVLEQACLLSEEADIRFAALVHDLGKATTPKDVLPQHIGHEARSLDLINGLCERLAVPKAYRELAIAVARDHTNCHRALELKPETIVKLLQRLDAFRRPEKLQQFLLCCEADARGREGLEDRDYPQADYLRQAFNLCQAISTQDIIAAGHTGKAIGEQLHKQRIAALKTIRP